MREISITETLADLVSKALKVQHDKAQAKHREVMDQYRFEIQQAEKEEDKAYNLLTSSIIDDSTYKKQISKIRLRKRNFEDLLEQSQSGITKKFYELISPLQKLADIKKATPKSGFLSVSKRWCPDADSNHGHKDFQSFALPTELSGHFQKRDS